MNLTCPFCRDKTRIDEIYPRGRKMYKAKCVNPDCPVQPESKPVKDKRKLEIGWCKWIEAKLEQRVML